MNDESNTLYLQEQDCEVILSFWNQYLQIRTKLLNPALVTIHKIIHQFDTDYYRSNDRSLITEVKENTKLVK